MTLVIKKLTSGFKKAKGTTEPTIASGFAKALLDLVVSKGANQQLLLERSHISLEDLRDQNNRIPLANYLALMNTGADLCREPALALHFGEAFTMPELTIVGLICQSVETPVEAIEQVNRYARLILDVGESGAAEWFEMSQGEDGVWLELTSRIYIDHPQLTESAFARIASGFARNFAGVRFAKAVHFTHAEPAYRAEYDRIFKVPVVFGSDRNALLLDMACLSVKLPANRYIFGVLSEHADALLKRLEGVKTVTGQVESLLIPVLHTGDLKMGLIAKKLGLSRATLYRKLKAEGVSYKELVDELRHQMAMHYLRGQRVSVNETAYLVGFSDPSAFSRAFKRWTGSSPGKTPPKE